MVVVRPTRERRCFSTHSRRGAARRGSHRRGPRGLDQTIDVIRKDGRRGSAYGGLWVSKRAADRRAWQSHIESIYRLGGCPDRSGDRRRSDASWRTLHATRQRGRHPAFTASWRSCGVCGATAASPRSLACRGLSGRTSHATARCRCCQVRRSNSSLASTVVPASTSMLLTTPAMGAFTVENIFIASSVNSGSPLATL